MVVNDCKLLPRIKQQQSDWRKSNDPPRIGLNEEPPNLIIDLIKLLQQLKPGWGEP